MILCVGDGSIMSTIEEFLNYDINIDDCIFCVIPFGTGNDFSNSLGWGSIIL